MSNSDDDNSPEDSDINVPPIKLPDPDPFDTSKSNEGKNSFLKRVKNKEKGRKGRHPLDPYKDVRREKKGTGCCGAIGCFALFAILFLVGGLAYFSYLMIGDFTDYTIVQLEGAEETIANAPVEPTFYLGKGKVIYNAPRTAVPIAILGRQIEVSGVFEDTLSLRGAKVTCRSGSHFRKNLDVYSVEFVDEGIKVDGKKKGKTLQ